VKTKTILLLGAGGVIAYLLLRKQPAAAQTSAVQQQADQVSMETALPVSPPLVASPAAPSDAQVVQSFMDANLNPCNKGRFDQLLPSMTPDELSSLSDIITNYWQAGNGNLPSDLRTFWDSWRVKYKINDNSICPFP
jgi:hypothetical protein